MRPTPRSRLMRAAHLILPLSALTTLGGCATLGSMMSPYSEKFSCKNDDHGQCIHPEQAYADAVAGATSKSDPAVTRDKSMLRDRGSRERSASRGDVSYADYRSSVYRELQGLIDQPVTPMLKPARTVRTLILPYADQHRPDRLYMQRYVFSILERPQWVVGDYLVTPQSSSSRIPILEQVRENAAQEDRP
ncbi:TraV family lipoprotein [Sandaracinobacter sp. RS1-74]|uniref:TraV family lipoprotein n=1 Tax=Sandaracinobacteroides sayramensis TaxID=2913411 RepID=UPI001EDAE7F6|nr:TraV family lipoprotein [Sandaracinobacteroides sayramensis]MCG2841315.1 TraV family lipoprotein [Sandaracinobacteroides sayramensis]